MSGAVDVATPTVANVPTVGLIYIYIRVSYTPSIYYSPNVPITDTLRSAIVTGMGFSYVNWN